MQSYPRSQESLHPARLDHFANTVREPVALKLFDGTTTQAQIDALRARHGNRLRLWGFKHSRKMQRSFDQLEPNDILLFVDHEQHTAWAAARVACTFISHDAAEAIANAGKWENFQGKNYPYLISLSKVRLDRYVPIDTIEKAIGTSIQRYSPSFYDLTPAAAQTISDLFTRRDAVVSTSLQPERIIVFVDEWQSHSGGISTFNRGLCYALADQGARVDCLITGSLEADVQPHSNLRIRRFREEDIPRIDKCATVIGHGRVTGGKAQDIARRHLRDATLVHIVHDDPRGVAIARISEGSDRELAAADTKAEAERIYCIDADVICGVGPKLTNLADSYRRSLQPGKRAPVLELLPGLPELKDGARALLDVQSSETRTVLVAGRLDDPVKGVQFFFQAVNLYYKERPEPNMQLIFRGFSENVGENFVREDLGQSPLPLKPQVRVYSENFETIERDLRQADVVCMPSREEGFGLIGLEAIACAVPILVPSDSGLGRFLLAIDEHDPGVVLYNGGERKVEQWEWYRMCVSAISDPVQSANDAEIRLRRVSSDLSWSKTAKRLLDAIGSVRKA